jgi:hypothetical protein
MKGKGPISTYLSVTSRLFLHQGNRRFVLSMLVLVLGLLGSAVPSRASTVGCAGASGGPFDFATLTDALNAQPIPSGTIFVSGTCTEFVLIAGAQGLQIIGTPGAAIVDPGDQFPPIGGVVEIDNSQFVALRGLSIQVASRTIDNAIPVILVQSSDVRVFGCRLEGAGASDGIDMFQSAVRLMGATVIENNNDGQGDGEGVFLQGPNATLFLFADGSGNCPTIQGNGDNGIFAFGGGATVINRPGRGCATIQNNGFGGIFGNLGATINLGLLQARAGLVQIVNNGFGVIANTGSRFNINGPVNIQGNTTAGIRMRAGSGFISASDGTAGPTIQGNGTTLNPICCSPAAGISVANNADLDMQGGQVTSNGAPGLIVQDNSSVRLIGTTSITNNPIGVKVTDVSSAGLFLAPSISGNSTADVVCGPDSVAHGDLSAVGKVICPQFKPQQIAGALPKHGKPIL